MVCRRPSKSFLRVGARHCNWQLTIGNCLSQHSIIGGDEDRLPNLRGDRAARAANAGIDHDDVDGVGGKIFRGVSKQERALLDTLRVRRDIVCDINDDRLRIDAENDAFHRADEFVARAKVSR